MNIIIGEKNDIVVIDKNKEKEISFDLYFLNEIEKINKDILGLNFEYFEKIENENKINFETVDYHFKDISFKPNLNIEEDEIKLKYVGFFKNEQSNFEYNISI